ncbi:hypothetical protein CLHUN_18820 [Ruminiclostridium hungatei]|uniref:Uncharacterized protein n=1 Tax=Ruminiclostridium hungatei TaxID=48256 RepID=A0A1V4SKR5_RUMHU|nr:hypothetical protein [Ruminiclostridium hungatei]OPX44086.1 hypothetical protein CLHUN_18820 [Ruminiclostridium hungatei]
MSTFTLETYLFERKTAFCNFLNPTTNINYTFHFHSILEAIYKNLLLLPYSNWESRKSFVPAKTAASENIDPIVFPQKYLSANTLHQRSTPSLTIKKFIKLHGL